MLPSDELLSAYLDGELTAEEQARAERLLASDEQARATFEELRAMRLSLQELPRKALPVDFAARVLRAAEQQVLSAVRQEDADRSSGAAGHSTWQERIRRPLAYVALVLAASLMIMLFNPEAPREKPERAVAMAPQDPAPPAIPGADGVAPELTAPQATRKLEEPGKLVEGLGERLDRSAAEAPTVASKKGAESESSSTTGQPAAALDALAIQQAAGSLLVVTCEITPNAAAHDTFRQVLARNQINLNDIDGEQGGQTAARQLRRPAPTPREPQQNRPSGDAGLEVVYVEATPAQLESTLAEISAQPKEFLSVEVGAADARGVQNRWQEQYSRGRVGLTQQRFLEPVAASPLAAAKVPATEKPADNTRYGQAANQAGQAAGRARAYAMPAEGTNNQRSAGAMPSVGQRQQSAAGESAAKRGEQTEKRDKVQATDEQRLSSPQEPGTLRALFVLRVAEEPAPAVQAPGKKE
jgi:negative regulator of sigma E activity